MAVVVVSALLTEVTGLVSGFAAAGAGVGAFAVLAAPAIKAVAGAIGDTRKQMALLSPDERGAVLGIQDLKDSFTKMSDAFQPVAFKTFNDLLKIANTLLPDLTPFANAAAKAIDGLLKGVNSFAGSAGFKDWLAQFQKLEGPSITAIGTGFGHVATSLGKLLTVMSAKDVVNAINIAFSVLTDTIKAVTFYIKLMMDTWDGLTTIFNLILTARSRRGSRHDSGTRFSTALADGFVAAFTTIAHWLQASDTATGNWVGNVGRLIGNVVSFFAKLPGEIHSALAGLGSMLFNIGKHAVQSLINGLMSLWDKLTSIFDKIKGFLGFGGGGGGGGKLPNVNVGLGGGPAANARLAQQMMPAWGSGANWNAWNYVAMKESGWNQHALNASSGAYGIPQALPASKMGAAANPPTSSPGAQIAWMVQYMRGRYGGPQGAAAHEQAFNWYDSGVQMLPPGLSLAMNGTGRPERVGGEDLGPKLDRVILAAAAVPARHRRRDRPRAAGNREARWRQGHVLGARSVGLMEGKP